MAKENTAQATSVKSATSKARSPQYPAIGLREAVEKVALIYEEDYQNAIPREVVAKHMGYQGLNGKSLGVVAALSKYGLIEGRGNDTRVTDLAVTIIAHPIGSPERVAALKDAATRPELFNELDARFQNGKASDVGIRSYLLTQKFIPAAADSAIRSYRETKTLVEEEMKGYNEPENHEEGSSNMQTSQVVQQGKPSIPAAPEALIHAGARRAVFTLDEGDVIITFPERLSTNSVDDLEEYLKIFMKKARRDADSPN